MSDNNNIRVLLVDDQQLIRDGIVSLLSLQPGIEMIGAAENGAMACDMVPELEPDLILMDISMPDIDGIGGMTVSRLVAAAMGVILRQQAIAAD